MPAFEAIFTEHGRFVWRLLVRLGVAERDAADVCQEVFLVVHRRLADFDPQRGALRSWVYGICAHAASDYRRRRPSRREASDEALLAVSVPGDQHQRLETNRAWHRLAQVLDDMDAAKRQVFVLYELESLPMADIASILHCPLPTAYARLHAARRLISAAFRDERSAP